MRVRSHDGGSRAPLDREKEFFPKEFHREKEFFPKEFFLPVRSHDGGSRAPLDGGGLFR